jgi:hypothetical protein
LLFTIECGSGGAVVSLSGPNYYIEHATQADSSGRFLIGPDVVGNIPANATFDLIITTYNGDMYAFNKIQTKADWNMEPELLIYKNCASAALVGLGQSTAQEATFTAFPIPASNTLFVSGFDAMKRYELILTDINGRKLMQVEVSEQQKQQLDISGLNSGLYFLQIKDEQGITKTLKFVK